MRYSDAFRMPVAMDLKGRTSSVTNAYVLGVIPYIEPTENEIKQVLDVLEMTPDKMHCAYCGGHYGSWDHFRPVVKDKKPTGYVSEIWNLIPSCTACNSSKGNKEWRKWITGTASKSPMNRNPDGLEERIKRIERYEQFTKDRCSHFVFEDIVGKERWQAYWKNHEALLNEMRQSQKLSDEIKSDVARHIRNSKK